MDHNKSGYGKIPEVDEMDTVVQNKSIESSRSYVKKLLLRAFNICITVFFNIFMPVVVIRYIYHCSKEIETNNAPHRTSQRTISTDTNVSHTSILLPDGFSFGMPIEDFDMPNDFLWMGKVLFSI